MRHEKKQRTGNKIFVRKQPGYRDILNALYDFLERFPFFLPLLGKILKKHKAYLNSDEKECCASAMECLIKIYIACAVSFSILFGCNPSVYTFITSIYFMYFFYMEITGSAVTKLEIRFLKGFDVFLGIIKHHYYKCGSIKDALMLSEADSPRIMKGHIREMTRCLNSPDPAAEINVFINSSYHKYLKLFLTLIKLVEENGDIEDEKGSVFLNACMNLKYDVEEDTRFISEKRHRFSGLVYTAVLPVIAIPYIAIWGVSTIPTLNLFYNGYWGTLIKIGLLAVSFLGYNAILMLRDSHLLGKKRHAVSTYLSDTGMIGRVTSVLMRLGKRKKYKLEEYLKRLCEGYSIKTLYTLKLIYFISGILFLVILLSIGHRESANIYKHEIFHADELMSVADPKQIEAMEKLIPEYTSYIIDNDLNRQKEDLISSFLKERDIRTDIVAEKGADEVLRRVEAYRKEYLNITDLLFALLMGLLLYRFPDLVISFKKSLIESRIQDEIMQYQSIIHMLKRIPGVSVVSLLEEMERFSEIFKTNIRQCINEFNISDEAALMRLHESERYAEWRRLTDCFMMADELGIEDAFDEISSEIENFKENRKLDRKLLLDTEGILGSLIAIIPGGVILFGYLLCPFMIRSIQIFNEYQTGMNMGF